MEAWTFATGHGDTMEDLLKEFDWQMQEKLEKPKRPVSVERIERVLEDKFKMVESVWLDIGGKEVEIRFDELAKAILAEINEGDGK